MAKGLAISLVVIGHSIQHQNVNFDDQLWFRVIYSFHMPLFVFLSGAVAAFWFNPLGTSQATLHSSFNQLAKRVKKAFIRLVLPFICWGLIGAAMQNQIQSISSLRAIIFGLFQRPDSGLWFLLCIFYSILLLNVLQFFIHLLRQFQPIRKLISSELASFLTILVFWLLIQTRLGNGSWFYDAKIYFTYFLLGLGLFKFLMPYISTWIYLSAIPIFIYAAPLWHRTKPHHLMNEAFTFASFTLVQTVFPAVVAACGILISLFIVKKLSSLNLPKIHYALSELGKLSLGIYAMHYYFMEITPPVIAPLLVSAILSLIILRIPILRVALLGERKS